MTPKQLEAKGLRVKDLEWGYHPMGEIAATGTGSAYIIDTRDAPRIRWGKWPNGHGPERETVAEMKYAAQADYEARVLAALEATNTSVGAEAIAAERQRQIEAEGFVASRDDEYRRGQFIKAAICYAYSAAGHAKKSKIMKERWPWGWSLDWFKPTTPRRDLEKAGALLAAEIDRLSRIQARHDERARLNDLHDGKYVVHKKWKGFYLPLAQGYTKTLSEAGIFTREEAEAYSYPNGKNGPRENIRYMTFADAMLDEHLVSEWKPAPRRKGDSQ